MITSQLRVFVSSNTRDLQQERKAIEAALQQLRKTEFAGMEYFASDSKPSSSVWVDELKRSKVFVGIIGARYGSGIIEQEFRQAKDQGLPCFIYFKAESSVPATLRETDPTQKTRLNAFKDELNRTQSVTEFQNSEDLAARLTADLGRWLIQRSPEPKILFVHAAASATKERRKAFETEFQEIAANIPSSRAAKSLEL